jgi:hypothetical protein
MGGALMVSSKSEAFKQATSGRGFDFERPLPAREALRLLDAPDSLAPPPDSPVMVLAGTRLRLVGTRPAQALSMRDFHLAGVGNDGRSDRAMYRRDDGEPVLFTFVPGQGGEFGSWLLWLPEELVAEEKDEADPAPRGLLKFLQRPAGAPGWLRA